MLDLGDLAYLILFIAYGISSRNVRLLNKKLKSQDDRVNRLEGTLLAMIEDKPDQLLLLDTASLEDVKEEETP